MNASTISFRAAVLFAVAGMIWGIAMVIAQNHATMPAHAHLNLLGWVSLFLFGVFYHLHPALDRLPSARAQVWIWIVASAITVAAVGLATGGHPEVEPLAGIGSFALLGDMLLFGWLVVRRDAIEDGATLGRPVALTR
jgi:hypothetical protein